MTNCFLELTSLAEKSSKNICYIAKIYNLNIIINIGASDLNYGYLIKHIEKLKRCDICILSHADLKYSGGLPFLFEIGFEGRILATVPVAKFFYKIAKAVNVPIFKKHFDKIKNDESFTLIENFKSQKYYRLKKFTKKDKISNTISVIDSNEDIKTKENSKITDSAVTNINNENKEEINDDCVSIQSVVKEFVITDCQSNTEELSNTNHNNFVNENISKLLLNELKPPQNDELCENEDILIKEDELCRFYEKNSIRKIYKSIEQVKYNQPIEINNEVTLTAHSSGYTIGGSVWKISTSKENILCCFDIDHRKEGYISGFDSQELEKASICIYNCKNKIEVTKKTDRNNAFFRLIYEHEKIVFFVPYVRLVEFLLVIIPFCNHSNKKVVVPSSKAKGFIESYKKMVEWLTSKENIDFHENNEVSTCYEYLEFSKNFKDADVIIFPSSFTNSLKLQCHIASLIEDPKITFCFTDEMQSDIFQKSVLSKQKSLPFLFWIQKHKKIKIKQKNLDISNTERYQNSFDNEDFISKSKNVEFENWHENNYDFWVSENNKRYAYFPKFIPKNYSEYGEIFSFKSPNNEEIPDNLSESNKSHQVLTNKTKKSLKKYVNFIKKRINIESNVVFLEFSSITEFDSIKRILKNLNLNHIIFTSNDIQIAQIYNEYFKTMFKTDYLHNFLKIPIKTHISILEIKNNMISNLIWKRLKFCQVSGANIMIDEKNEINLSKKALNIWFSQININILKNDLIDDNFVPEIKKNTINVNSKIYVRFLDDNSVSIEGEYTDLYQLVKKTILKRMAYV